MANDFNDGVKAGFVGASTGAAIAGAGAAIGAAAGAALGPFAVIAAPVGAAVGALLGFFVGLFENKQTPEQLAAAQAAHEKAVAQALASTDLLKFNVIKLGQFAWGSPPSLAFQSMLHREAEANPAWAPIIEEYIKAVHDASDKTHMADSDPHFKKLQAFLLALAGMGPTFAADPMVYMTPPLSTVFGPALAAAGINISDPDVLKMMRGNYDVGQAAVAIPRTKIGTIPIARKSLGVRSGGKAPIDQRAFSTKIAPNGVISYAMAPEAAAQEWYKAEPYASQHGVPLLAVWPYGLDADRFALPPPKTSKTAADVAKIGVPLAVGAALLFFL